MSFTDIFIKRPVLASVVSLLILLIGLRAVSELTLREFPKLTNTVILVTTAYPGASADLMEGFITQPLEQSVSQAEGVDYVTSTSVQGNSTIRITIRLNFDPEKALTEIIAKTQEVKYLLPTAAFDPVITKNAGGRNSLLYLAFLSQTMDPAAISDYIDRVARPILATVPGVGKLTSFGGSVYAMRIWLDPARMAARGVGADDIATAIRANNFQSAPGKVKGYFTVSNVQAETDLPTVEEFEALIVKAQQDELVRLGDVARVELGPQATELSAFLNGQRGVFIAVDQAPDANPLDVAQGVIARTPELSRSLPPGLSYKVGYDTTQYIRASINEVARTLVEAVLIVVLVIFLMLGNLRAVLIPVVAIPLSLIGTQALMLAAGFSINLLTLLALVLAIGLVVDDAIVVVENIYRGIERGLSPMEAALEGAREIAVPVITMTITLAAVYAPVGLLGGLTGALFREFAFTLAGAVILSGVIALTLSPMMSSRLLSRHRGGGWYELRAERAFTRLGNFYGRRLRASLNWRPVTLTMALGSLGIVGMSYALSPHELAPQEDSGFAFYFLKGPQPTNLDYTNVYLQQFAKLVMAQPDTEFIFAIGGGGGSVSTAFGGAVMKPWADRTLSTKDYIGKLQGLAKEQVPGSRAFMQAASPLPDTSDGLPVQLVISSADDYATLYKLITEIRQRADKSGLFIATDTDLAFDQPTVRLKIDRAKVSDLGLSMQSIGDTLAILVGENYINRFNLAGRSYEVITQVPQADRLTPDGLTNYYVQTPKGDAVALSSVLEASVESQPNSLTHYNQLNAATFSAVLFPGRSMGEAVDFLERTANEVLPTTVEHDFLGESRQYLQEGNRLLYTFAFAIIVIFLVLAAQFESFRDPFVILVSVPMALLGALLPIFLGVSTLNIFSQIGLVTLVGLISKHGILMVEFANEIRRTEGLNRIDAIVRAAGIRLRPILMTTAATVAGVLPLLFATGPGSGSRFSIAVVIVGGMSVGTIFTLFVLPMVYSYVAHPDHAVGSAEARGRPSDAKGSHVPAE